MTKPQKMTKGTSKAQRRAKAKSKNRRTISLAGGMVATAPIGQGQSPKQEDARKTAIQSRVRRYKIEATASKTAEQEAASPLCGSGIGMCIRSVGGQAAIDMADAWGAICAARHAFVTRYLGLTETAQGSAVAMQSEAMQADVSHTIDIRSPEEKDRDAVRSWDRWEAAINALPAPQFKRAIRNAITGGLDGLGGDVWQDDAPTQKGRNFIAALGVLVKTTA